MADFCDAVRTGGTPRSSSELGVEVVRMVEAVDASLASHGARVSLDEASLLAADEGARARQAPASTPSSTSSVAGKDAPRARASELPSGQRAELKESGRIAGRHADAAIAEEPDQRLRRRQTLHVELVGHSVKTHPPRSAADRAPPVQPPALACPREADLGSDPERGGGVLAEVDRPGPAKASSPSSTSTSSQTMSVPARRARRVGELFPPKRSPTMPQAVPPSASAAAVEALPSEPVCEDGRRRCKERMDELVGRERSRDGVTRTPRVAMEVDPPARPELQERP